MKKFALLGIGLLFAGTAVAVTISAIPVIADKNVDDTLSHTEWNSVAQGVEDLATAFSGVASDAGTVTFPGKVNATEVCIGGVCKAVWPEGAVATSLWTEAGANINRASGSVGIGVASPTEKLEVAGNVKATAFLYSSDAKLKENVSVISGALEKIKKLRGVSFTWKDSGEESIGFIAQEVEEVLPTLVKTGNETELKSVAYGNITAILVEAIKEQQKQIDELTAAIEALK